MNRKILYIVKILTALRSLFPESLTFYKYSTFFPNCKVLPVLFVKIYENL